MKPEFAIVIAVGVLTALLLLLFSPISKFSNRLALIPEPQRSTLAALPLDYEKIVRPILNRRCVVCHACYDAPCQLKISSYEGIQRGASKDSVYNAARLLASDPTRLSIDAQDPNEWRSKGFFSVSDEKGDSGQMGKASSLLLRMIELGHAHRFTERERLPASVDLDINRALSCPTQEDFDQYAAENHWGGMPYGMTRLSEDEYEVLATWASIGAPDNKPRDAPLFKVPRSVEMWEKFLNGKTPKRRLIGRYLYEHLFLAHLYFEDVSSGRYFRLVRSRTPIGQTIDEIATRHPNDPPGQEHFYYRLQPIVSTIVHKTHIVYPLSKKRLARVKDSFLGSKWQLEKPPGYDERYRSNPFLTFAAIPPRARYQFMLDSARYFIMTFIRGPVCRGQVALNVIDDHFFVAFFDPGFDLSITDREYLEIAKELTKVPEESDTPLTLLQQWKTFYAAHRDYLRFRDRAYYESDPTGVDVSLETFFRGNDDNRNAFLTIFRHFDSASVIPGFVGEIPKKMLVLDYPILERIYYNLVVNFDVFGNVTHQLMTRLTMDYLRMEAENNTLSFLPAKMREKVRSSWYRGAEAQAKLFLAHQSPGQSRGTSLNLSDDNPLRALIVRMLRHFPALRKSPDFLNRSEVSISRQNMKPAELQLAEEELQRLTATRAAFVGHMPDLAYLRVSNEENRDQDHVYTLIRNEAHKNVAFIFGEAFRRIEAEDALTIVNGFVGSYPNFFFEVPLPDVSTFVEQLTSVEGAKDFRIFVERYGVRRTDPRFWEMSDWFNDHYAKVAPLESGLLDLNRYGNY